MWIHLKFSITSQTNDSSTNSVKQCENMYFTFGQTFDREGFSIKDICTKENQEKMSFLSQDRQSKKQN